MMRTNVDARRRARDGAGAFPGRAFAALSLVACALFAAAALVAPHAAIAAGRGSIRIVSSQGTKMTYGAYRIADSDALPEDGTFAWEKLSGATSPSGEAYPTYDPAAPMAAAQGRELVERASADLQRDEDGGVAHWLADFLLPDAAPDATVEVDAAAVPVDDGWYLLSAPGRRPLFAWVKGTAVELGDKSDTPVLEKLVKTGDGWVAAAFVGSGAPVEFRIDVTLPTTIELFARYGLSIHDTWDESLALDASSVKVELVPADEARGGAVDITGRFDLTTDAASATLAIENVHDIGALPGDVVRVTYKMALDPLAVPGALGARNVAWAAYPALGGLGKTPGDAVRVHAVKLLVSKTDAAERPLAGADFALANEDGRWLASNGAFGPESGRAVFTTDEDGLIGCIPLLEPGTYDLLELKAPEGYALPRDPVTKLRVSARADPESIELDGSATGAGSMLAVNADRAEVTVRVVNKAKPATPGWMPQTGDASWAIPVALVTLGAASLVAARRIGDR